MFGRSKPSPTQKQQLLDELGQSYGHLKLAAGHVAGGATETITPTYDKARNAATRGWTTTKVAFAPIYSQMREGAANARMEVEVSKKNRWPMLVGLLAAGAAVGAAGAMVARRRRVAVQWEEYEPMPAIDEIGVETEQTGGGMSSTTKKVAAAGATVADTVSAQAGKLADTLHEKSGTSSPTSTIASQTEDVAEKGTTKAGDAASSMKSKGSGSGSGKSSLSSFAEEAAEDVATETKKARP